MTTMTTLLYNTRVQLIFISVISVLLLIMLRRYEVYTHIYIYIYIYSRSSVTQHADNLTLPITQHPTNIWLDSYILHVNKNPITQQI